MFATYSADWTLKLWDDENLSSPLFKFDFTHAVTDFDWCPFSATVFAVSTEDGTVSCVLCTRLFSVGFTALKGEVKAKIKISPVVVFGVLSRMVVVRGS